MAILISDRAELASLYIFDRNGISVLVKELNYVRRAIGMNMNDHPDLPRKQLSFGRIDGRGKNDTTVLRKHAL
jgi:hypothetical protein